MTRKLKYKLEKQGRMIKMEKCRYCKSTENLTIDHKIPVCQGGTDDYKNLQCLCKSCNQFKSGMSHKQITHIISWWLRIRPEEKILEQMKQVKKNYKKGDNSEILSPNLKLTI